MYFKTENLHYDERKYVKGISDIVHWAKQNNRQDILNEVDSYGTINNYTRLRNAYYTLNKLKNTENNSFSNINTSTTKTETMENVNPSQPQESNEPKPQPAQPAQPAQPVNQDNTAFDPLLSANPKQRDYTSGLGGQTPPANQPMGSIPEPDFAGKASGGFGQVPPNEKDNRFSELPPEEKKKGSAELADVLISGYCTILQTGFTALSVISPKKVNTLVQEGVLDLNVLINVPPQAMTVGEYIDTTNQRVAETFVVEEQWKNDIRPYVERELSKRNWGISDGQVIIYMALTQAAKMGYACMQLRNSNNQVLESLVENQRMMREAGIINTPPPSNGTSGQNPTPPPPPPPIVPTEPDIITPDVIIEEPASEGFDVVTTFEPPRMRETLTTPPSNEAEFMPTVNGQLNGE